MQQTTLSAREGKTRQAIIGKRDTKKKLYMRFIIDSEFNP